MKLNMHYLPGFEESIRFASDKSIRGGMPSFISFKASGLIGTLMDWNIEFAVMTRLRGDPWDKVRGFFPPFEV